MKRQRGNGEKSTAAATGKSTRKTLRSKVGAEPAADHGKDGGGGGGLTNVTTAAAATAAIATCGAAAAAAAAAVAPECDLYNIGGGDLDYEQMWWSSIWLPIWDVEHYLVDDDGGGDGLCDIDDIWNLKSIN